MDVPEKRRKRSDGVYETTIVGCLEEQRARLATQRKAPPFWNQGSFANGGDVEAQMVGQGLGRSIEASLECRTDYAREERVLYNLSRP